MECGQEKKKKSGFREKLEGIEKRREEILLIIKFKW